MALWAVGAVINVIGSILINLGTNVIKLGHTRTAALAQGPHPKLLRAPRRWWHTPGNKMWLAGMAAFGVGNLLNFASFAFAAQSLLSALGVVQFISNIVFGRFVNKEKVTKRVLFATAIVCCGCVLLVAFGNHESPTLSAHDLLELYSKPPYIAYLCFIFTCAPAMYGVYRHGKRAVLADQSGVAARKWARWLPISYALFAGLLGTQSVLYGKTMSMLLRTTFSGDSQFTNWYTYIAIFLFLLFATFWMRRYSKAMKLFPVLIIMPIIQIVWVLFSLISGSLYYQEYKTLNALSGSMFGLGVVVLLVGVHLLTGGKPAVQQPPQPKPLELELTEEEGGRGEAPDREALRSKAPLSDGLDAGVEVEVSAAGALEPEEALVARRLSTVYERKSAQPVGGGGGGASAGARPASAPAARHAGGWPEPDEGSASEASASASALVLGGVRDSAAPESALWPAANGASPAAPPAGVAARQPSARSLATQGAALSEVVVSTRTKDSGTSTPGAGEGRPASAAAAAAAALGSSPPPASLMQDLRADWGVGVRDLNAVVRASVGLPQDDEEGTAISLWSMPMPASASFTGQGRARSVDLHRATFRIRSAFEQQLAGGDSSSAGGGGLTGLVGLPATTDQLYPAGSLSGARLGRPGHRRINRSRSANELDDMLRAAALGGDADLGGPAPWPGGERDIECVGSPWRADSATTAGTAADAATGGVGAGSRRGPGAAAEGRLGRLAALQRHPSPSAPALSALQLDGGGPAGLSTPPPAGGGMQMPSAPGSAPRRPWNVEAPAGLFPAFSQASHQDESEGPRAGSPAPVPREGGLPISDFLPSLSMSMSFSPPGSEGSIALAARAWQQAGKKGDKAS